jgi:two-component system NtrC family sensor kinase
MIAASIVLPAMLFAITAWLDYRNFERLTNERIERTVDIVHEHALKVLQTVRVVFGEIDAITSGMSDDDIRLNQGPLHDRLARIARDLPQLQGITIIDRDGHPLVSSSINPVPTNFDFSSRDYFKAQVVTPSGTYVSGVHTARMLGTDSYFFAVSRARIGDDGKFNGIVAISVLPSYFEGFFARLGHEGSYLALARGDGGFLARYPLLKNRARILDPNDPFRVGIAHGLDRRIYWVTSELDGIERRVAYRKLMGFPLYVFAGVDRSAIVSEWLRYNINYLIFALPLTVLLCAGLALALRRTRRLYDEADRREAAEGALRQAQRLEAIGQLTGGVAHDFNNLLMIISGSVQRLRNEISEKKARRLLDMIATATQRGETLTRKLLAYSRRQTLTPQVIDLSQRLPELRDLLARSLRTDIEIKVEVPETACAIRVDPAEFELAILNLAVNAKDAMPAGGVLSIRAKPVTLKGEASEEGLSGDFVAIRVSDTGQGIPAEVMTRVFEPFFTTKEVGKGTGLGLSQVYGFAKQSGGTVTVSSKEGRGTTVTIYLPRTDEPPPAIEQPSQAPAQVESAGTALLVEDNTDVAEVAAGLLHQLGYRVRSVANVQAALAALRLDPQVDLVFSDILMPGGRNGLDLAREVGERFPHIPLLLTTGYSAGAQDAVRYGVAVLQKPYDIEGLRRHIGEAVERTRARSADVVQAE